MNFLAISCLANMFAFVGPLALPLATHGADVLTLSAEGPLMLRIPKGETVIGSSAEEVLAAAASCAGEPLGHRCSAQTFADELGRHTLKLASFWIDRTEVTVREYERCVAAGRCTPPEFAAGARRFDVPEYPVTFVSYYDATNFCAFRAARLPTEAEYERAARGAFGRSYPWGDLYNAHSTNHGRFALQPNDPDDGYAELAPVGSFPSGRTPEGVLDLVGNAAEWIADAYRDNYDDPKPSANDARRCLRGGSFASGAAWLRGAAREAAAPDTRRPDIGFRCASSADGTRP